MGNVIHISNIQEPDGLFFNYSCYSSTFKLIDTAGYWDPDMIPEDWHIFLQAFFATSGQAAVNPIFLPTIVDAPSGNGFFDALKNRYNQSVRHAWGAVDIPYAIEQARIHTEIPLITRVLRVFKLIETHFIWSSNWFILTLGTGLPAILNPSFFQTAFGYNLPRISNIILTICLIPLFSLIILDWILRPNNGEKNFKNALKNLLQWPFIAHCHFDHVRSPGLHSHTKTHVRQALGIQNDSKKSLIMHNKMINGTKIFQTLLLLISIGLFIFLRLPSLFEPYWYGDEGIYLALGQGLRAGLNLYSQIHDNKPPILYYLAALGQTVFGFRLLLALVMVPTLYLFHRLASKFLSPLQAKAAFFLFLILSSIPLLEGNIANAEVFMLLPTILGVYLFLNPVNSVYFLYSGLVLGLALAIKIPVAVEIGALFLWQLLNLKNIKTFLVQMTIFAFGSLLPVSLFAVFYAFQGSLDNYLFAALLIILAFVLVQWHTYFVTIRRRSAV
jgi:hypothetical protein